MSSLQDQLLKAGLTTKDKANQVKTAKRKQQKIARKQKQSVTDEAKLAAEQAIAAKAEKDRQLNAAKNQKAEAKAIAAQIRQIIQSNEQDSGKPAVKFNFSDQGAVKSIEVANLVHRHLSDGRLAIAKLDDSYVLVPKNIAEKIQEKAPEAIILLNQLDETMDDDDPYADYQIPDDLMW